MKLSRCCGSIATVLCLACAPAEPEEDPRVTLARQDLAGQLGVPVEAIELLGIEEITWPDSSLGCPEPGMSYAQATQEGYRILLAAEGDEFAYHGGGEMAPFLCRPGLENGSFMAELNGFDIHYEIHGQGPVLMTVPNSWGLSIAGLRGVFGLLEDRLTLVYFDPRGMGQSDPIREEADMSMAAVRADFEALRQHLGLDQVHAMGWSNGAGNLILLAAEYPDTLSSAIFVHGQASYTPEDAAEFAARYPDLMVKYQDFMAEMQDESLTEEDRTARVKEMWLSDFFPLMLADPESNKPLVDAAFAAAEFSWSHGQYANQESSVFDTRDKLPDIPTRSLVIAGAHDMSPPAKVQELADGLADSVFMVFEESGHFAPLEEPEGFKAIVFDFLDVG